MILLLGCTRWESYQVAPESKPSLPSYVRVSARGQASTILIDPSVQQDTLYGRSRGDSVAIALNAIEQLERPRLDGLRTVAAVVGGLAAWIGLALVEGGVLE